MFPEYQGASHLGGNSLTRSSIHLNIAEFLSEVVTQVSLGDCQIHILTQEGMRFHELLRATTTIVMDLVVGQVIDTGAV